MSDNPSDHIKEFVDTLSSVLGLLYKLAMLGGAFIVLSYCIHIGFHPKGMSIGDALLFFFALFAFAAIDVIGLAYSAVSILWLMALLAKIPKFLGFDAKHKFSSELAEDKVQVTLPNKESKSICLWLSRVIKWRPYREVRLKHFISGIFLAVSFLLSLVYFEILHSAFITDNEHSRQIFGLLSGFLSGGMFVALGLVFEFAPVPIEELKNGALEQSGSSWKYKMLLPLSVLVLPILIGAPGLMMEMSMHMIGLRSENAPVQVSEENFTKLTAIADRLGIPILDCRAQNNERIVYGLDVLWHGIGESAYVHIEDRKNSEHKKEKSYAEFELKDSGVSPIATNQKFTPCFELKTDTLFDSHKWNLKSGAEPVMEAFEQELGNLGKIESVVVTGYSDPMPATVPDNYVLSELRANTIKKWLIEHKLLTEMQVIAHGVGPIKPVVVCPVEHSVEDQRQCNAPNRRVEVVVRLSSFSKTADKT